MLRPRFRLAALSLTLALGLGAMNTHAQGTVESAAAPISIAAQPLDTALSELARQAKLQLLVAPDLVAGKTAPAIRGAHSAEDALQQLLLGSGLSAHKDAAGTIVIVNSAAAADAHRTSSAEATLPAIKVTASAPSATELPAAYAGGQVAKGGRLGLLGNTDFMGTPFNQTSYTAELIEDQQARSLSDLLIDDPSVRLSSARSNINEDFSIRGFTVSSQDVALNGMYGLMPFFRVPIEIAERVEVLKGPSALLNGMPPSGNVGGAINIVPKRAGYDPLNRVTAGYVSDSIFGVHADIGRRFGPDKQFGVRVNAAYRDGDTAIDKQKQTDQIYALALDYQGERLRASLDVMHQDQNIERVVRQFQPDPALTALPRAPDSDLNYPGYGRSRADDTTVVAHAEYDLNRNVTVYGGLGKRRHNMDALAGNPVLLNTAGDFASTPAWQLFEVNSTSSEAGTNIRFSTGPVTHKLALNYSKIHQKNNIDFDTFFAARTSNIYDPIYSATPSVDRDTINLEPYLESELSSYALADTLGFFDDKLKLTLGIRHQSVEQQRFLFTTDPRPYDKSKNTPAVGIVFQPYKNLSFYANYIEALSPGATSLATVPPTTLPPVVTRQYEIGSKIDWGKFATTLSLYQIERPNAALFGGVLKENGEQRNRGVELNVFGEIARDVRLLGGLVYMDGDLTKTADGTFEGNNPIAVPRWQANIGMDWNNIFVPGFGLNTRIVYTGAQYADQANLLRMPSWTRFDLGARYKTRVGGKSVVLRANIENLLDKDYWASSNEGFLYVGSPRTVLMSATVDF